MESVKSLSIESVINGNYCVGCGACAVVNKACYSIRPNQNQTYKAKFGCKVDTSSASEVCPFSADNLDENRIGQELFQNGSKHDKFIGNYLSLFVGHVNEGSFRELGSSGGVGKWLLKELLKTGIVDFVIHVVEKDKIAPDGPVYEFSVSGDPDQVAKGSKSVYYPVEMSGVLSHVRKNPGRYAITGVPCFIKAVRLLARQEQVFQDRIRFCIGMFCGHLKSTAYAEMLAWQMGVEPKDLSSIDFRGKIPQKPANVKGIYVRSKSDPKTLVGPAITRELFGGGYNYGFFQYKACDYCDDVVAETADVSIGDAWLPEYVKDHKGTSILIVRNRVIDKIIQTAVMEGRLHLQPISNKKVIQSQWGGFKHRREGLAYRLELADKQGVWRPKKRVKAGSLFLSKKRKEIYRLRMQLREASHVAFKRAKAANNFDLFRNEMEPLLTQYQSYYLPSFSRRVKRGIARRLQKLIKQIF